MTWFVLAVSTVLTLLLGSGSTPSPPLSPPLSPPPVHAGVPADLVASWSEGDHPDLDRAVGTEEVVDDVAGRDDLVRRLAGAGVEDAAERLGAVDLATHVLVAGGYPRCTEWSRVVEDAAGLHLDVVPGDEDLACEWSPYTVDVHAVPRRR